VSLGGDAFEQIPYAPAAGATELIVVRHGASEAATEGTSFPLVEGRGDPPLAAAGKGHAKAVAARLADEPFEAVFVSSLRRTHETATPLLAARGMRHTVVPELSEVHLGEFEGGEYRIRSARGDEVARRVFEEQRWDVIPGAEPAADFARRIQAAVSRVVALTGADRIAVVFAHGAVIGEICRQATDSRPLAFAHSDNGSISRVVVGADGQWVLRSFNEISHL
jgi:2,3-bisphosphoglycerate-dependent phosphoglycerate mutase